MQAEVTGPEVTIPTLVRHVLSKALGSMWLSTGPKMKHEA